MLDCIRRLQPWSLVITRSSHRSIGILQAQSSKARKIVVYYTDYTTTTTRSVRLASLGIGNNHSMASPLVALSMARSSVSPTLVRWAWPPSSVLVVRVTESNSSLDPLALVSVSPTHQAKSLVRRHLSPGQAQVEGASRLELSQE